MSAGENERTKELSLCFSFNRAVEFQSRVERSSQKLVLIACRPFFGLTLVVGFCSPSCSATILRGSSGTIIWQEKKVSEQEFRRPHRKCSHRSGTLRRFANQNLLGHPDTLTKGCSILVSISLRCTLKVLSPFWTTSPTS